MLSEERSSMVIADIHSNSGLINVITLLMVNDRHDGDLLIYRLLGRSVRVFRGWAEWLGLFDLAVFCSDSCSWHDYYSRAAAPDYHWQANLAVLVSA
jgi:hypothetical protein